MPQPKHFRQRAWPMRALIPLMTGMALASQAGSTLAQAQAQARPKSPPPFYTEAADCTAAFQARVLTRLAQPKNEARDKAILRDTELGFIFIGVAYKEGLRSPEAEQMLKAAEKRWAQLGRAEQDSRLTTCTAKANELMDDVTFVERYLVKNRAKARVDRLLEKEADKS